MLRLVRKDSLITKSPPVATSQTGAKRNDRRSVIAPVNRLPSELLSNIILIVSEEWNEQYTGMALAINIARVCRRWRNVAINTGALWSNINFIGSKRFDLAQLWLDRTNGCLFDLIIDVGKMKKTRKEYLTKALDCVGPYLARCRTFTLRTDYEEDVEAAFLSLVNANPSPKIQTLAVCAHQAGRYLVLPDSLEEKVREWWGKGDNPRRLSMHGFHLPTIKFAELTNLELIYSSIEPLHSASRLEDMLRASPRLRTIVLGGIVSFLDEGSIARPVTPIELPELRYVTLGAMWPSEITHILSLISAPALKEFGLVLPVRLGDIQNDGLVPGLVSFLTRQSQSQEDGACTIVEVGLQGLYDEWEPGELASLLSLLPKLETLHIVDCTIANDILRELTPPSESSDLPIRCPSLHRLRLESCRQLNIDTLKQVIKARRNIHACDAKGVVKAIDNLTLTSCRWKGSKMRSRVQRGIQNIFWKDSKRLLAP